MSNIQLANNLRYLRKKHGLTQKDLSEMLNISRQAYSNYETSKRTPDLDTLLYLSSFYRTGLGDLILRNLNGLSGCADRQAKERAPYVMAESKKTGASIYLSDEELDFLIHFRSLSRENKQLIAGFLSNTRND